MTSTTAWISMDRQAAQIELRTVCESPYAAAMAKLTYQRTIVGYHGCDAAIANEVMAGSLQLRPSANPYDWLGEGVYFWEHGPRRAFEWALQQSRLFGMKVKQPTVLGARINLGVC